MKSVYYDWYEIVEEQSDVAMAHLALDDVEFSVMVDDPNGFLVVDIKHLPEELLSFLSEDMALPVLPFPDRDKVLLQNEKLHKYLRLAKGFKAYDPMDNDYVEVLFERVDDHLSLLATDIIDPLDLNSIFGESVAIFGCWELFKRLENKELVYELATEAMAELKSETNNLFDHDEFTPKELKNLFSNFMGYVTIAVIFAWLKEFEKAASLVRFTGYVKVRYAPMAIFLRYFLEILIIHEQEDLLADFFADEVVREGYLTHYEIYMITFVDADFACTRVQQIKSVQNRIAVCRDIYL
jgi:hypothetical protein